MSETFLTAILTKAGLILLRCITLLPYALQIKIGFLFGQITKQLAPRWKETAKKNISAAFPNLNKQEQRTLLQRHFNSLGIGLIEMANAWWGNNNKLKKLVTIDGLEHFDSALEQGNGIILLSAHFTTLEIGGKLLSLFRPIHAMYRQQDNPIFNRAMENGRRSFLKSIISKNDLRSMLRILKDNQPIWYAIDQNSSDSNAIFVDFFGIPCSTTTATSKLARHSGAIVIPFTIERLDSENRYNLTIHPPFKNFPGNDATVDTQRLMDHFEAEIRKIPEQYLWIHRRFKNRPVGSPNFYD